jgi:hypothetical protein
MKQCRKIAAVLAIVTANVACSNRVAIRLPEIVTAEQKTLYQPTAEQRALGIYQPYSDADIHFMTGWAASRGTRKDIAVLCERILVGQMDEIRWMQQWLSDRGLPAPDATSTRMKMKMGGIEHDMLMPGMLTDEEARGSEFDRLFLLGMIKHHQGAIDMVNDLFESYGAAQDDATYTFASDVYSDQSIEIEVMQNLLEPL